MIFMERNTAMTTEQDQSRADFEALGQSRGWNLTAIMVTSMPLEFRHYADETTQACWEAWQAARTLPAKGIDPMLDTPTGLELASGQCRFTGEVAWRECSAEHVSLVLSTPNEWEGYEVRYLYAAPRLQDRRPPLSLTTAQLQKLGRWLAKPSDLDGDQPLPRK